LRSILLQTGLGHCDNPQDPLDVLHLRAAFVLDLLEGKLLFSLNLGVDLSSDQLKKAKLQLDNGCETYINGHRITPEAFRTLRVDKRLDDLIMNAVVFLMNDCMESPSRAVVFESYAMTKLRDQDFSSACDNYFKGLDVSSPPVKLYFVLHLPDHWAELSVDRQTGEMKGSCSLGMEKVTHNTHTHIHTHTRTHINTRIHTLLHAYTHTHTQIYIYTHTHTHARTYTHTHTHTNTHKHKYIYTHARTHTHTHTHAHTGE
jgi:hypothetical protein